METNMRSETIGELAKSLSKAQGVLDHAKKDVANDFYKSKYATLANVLDAAKAPLAENGLAVTQTTDLDGDGCIVLTTTLLHSSGEWIASRYPVDPVKRDPQGYGSALSYARRYAFSALIGVAAADDDGEGAMGRGKGHSQEMDRMPSLPPTKPLPAGSFRPAETVSTPKPPTQSASTDKGKTIWRNVVCHLGQKGGRVNGKTLGTLSEVSIDWCEKTVNAIANPTQQDNLLKAALAMRQAEMAPTPAQAELGSSRVSLDALRAKATEAKIPLEVIAKVSRTLGGSAKTFEEIPEDEAGFMTASWEDTKEAVKNELDMLP